MFRPTIFLPSLAYALAFTYSNVLLTIEIPALLGRKEGLNAQQTGVGFFACIKVVSHADLELASCNSSQLSLEVFSENLLLDGVPTSSVSFFFQTL